MTRYCIGMMNEMGEPTRLTRWYDEAEYDDLDCQLESFWKQYPAAIIDIYTDAEAPDL